MSIRTAECRLMVCDADDKCEWWEEAADGFEPHFQTAEAAVEWAKECDWQVDGDRHVCPRHAVEALCAAQGHDWAAWSPCRCAGRIKDHEVGVWKWRICGRDYCHAAEWRQAVLA